MWRNVGRETYGHGVWLLMNDRGMRRVVINELGPAMLALTEKQRRFVVAYVEFPQATGTDLAAMAGYKQKQGSRIWSKTASKMLRDPGIIAAIHELLSKTYRGRGAAIAQDVMLTIAKDKKHKDQLKAAAMLADRGGFAAMFEQKVTVEHRDQTSEAILNRIQGLAKRLGPLEVARLLGHPMKEIVDGRLNPDQGQGVAGPEGNSAGGADDAGPARRGAAAPATPADLDDRGAHLPQQQTVRLDQ